MRNTPKPGESSSIHRIGTARVAILGVLLGLSAAIASAQSPFDATPDNNEAIAVTQGALGSAHAASVIGGIAAPGFFGVGFELLALGTDISLKNTPPTLQLPGSRAVFPNAVATGDLSGQQCVYKFANSIRMDDYDGGVEEGFASIFYVPFDPLDAVFADLGTPDVYHVQADVRVRARNHYLSRGAYAEFGEGQVGLLQQRPEFPAGHHAINWEAQSSLNTIMDIGIPGVLIPIGIGAEGYLAKRVASSSRRAFIDNSVGIAVELGLIGADVSSLPAKTQWYNDTQLFTAANRGTQSFTVWDTSVPYLRDTGSNAAPLSEQAIELQATDFGGVRFGRVAGDLRARFEAIEPCGRQFEVSTDSPSARLFSIGTPHDVVWEIREIDGGPYRADVSLAGNQERDGDNLVTYLTQRISVVDTQAPILVAPSGFARYEENGIDLTAGGFPLGRPRVVDLADPSPTVTNDAPAFLPGPPAGADGVRYEITWDAIDDSQNSSVATSSDPASFVQTITLKRPGTNTVPTALPTGTATVTANTVDIRLQGIDIDMIDGRVDPLEFEIERYPVNGQLDAPLYPYFIEDFRLTPVGEREDGDNLTRVSPLLHLANAFRLTNPNDHGTFLTNQICNAAPGSVNRTTFGGVIPVNMVYEPGYVHVDDAGFYYIYDKYYVCGESQKSNSDLRPTLSPLPRLSKWTAEGELVATTPLYATDNPDETGDHLWVNGWPQGRFSVDHDGRLWVEWRPIFTTFTATAYHYSFDSNLGDVRFHGLVNYNEGQAINGERLRDVGSDSKLNILYQLNLRRIDVVTLDQDNVFTGTSGLVGALDVSDIDMSSVGYWNNPSLRHGIGEDLAVDRDGNVYVLDSERNRVHKWAAAKADDAGGIQLGDYIGWMGSCTGNKTIDGTPTGIPYNACEVATGTSRGYACSDSRCTQASPFAATAGAGPGQFNAPSSIEIDPRNVLYVADTENLRVQRFGPDGTFAGQAKSTGSGVNQGAEPGFILGNMGKPKTLSVNSDSFFVMEPDAPNGDSFVHVFKTLPFRDITPSSATVRYISNTTFQGYDSFTYTVNDGIDQSQPAVVDVSVARAYRAPENLRAQCFATSALDTQIRCELPEDSEIYVRLSASDPDGYVSDLPYGLDTLTFDLLDEPLHGTLSLDDPSFEQDNAITYRYVPAPDFNGSDSLRFRAFDGDSYSLDDSTLNLMITPVPDPVVVEVDGDLRGARGFPAIVSARFSDVDNEPDVQPALASMDWGDGTVAGPALWTGSGRLDLNGREISPQLDFGRGSGVLLGSHVYAENGTQTIEWVLNHAPAENLPSAVWSSEIEIIDATVVGAGLAAPADAVSPDAAFPIVITVTNQQPSTWDGLTATDVGIAFDVPPGLEISPDDARCTGDVRVSCTLGSLSPGESTDVTLGGFISLDAARNQAMYQVQLNINDAGPKLAPVTLANLVVAVVDSDGDSVIDAVDAYVDNPRYHADTDGDGLADRWELEFGFNPGVGDDVSADVDGDGYSLLEEFQQGSFPLLAEGEAIVEGNRLVAPGEPVLDYFGMAMAGGDLNLDGYADLVIGARGRAVAGVTYIAWGGPGGANPVLQELLPADGRKGGRAVAVGDWDGNGYPDLATVNDTTLAIHWNNGQILNQPDLRLSMTGGVNTFPLDIASGDLDNDGIDDLVAVITLPDGTGRFDLFLSSSGGPATGRQSFYDSGYHRSPVIADVDGDNLPDLVLGFPVAGAVSGYLGAENDWKMPGSLTRSFFLTAPAGNTGGFGTSIASGEDVTGDGIDDLVVGAYGSGGTVYLYDSATDYITNPATGPAQSIAGMGEVEGNTYGDQFGYSVALGHLDLDGHADLVGGGNRAGQDDQGYARVLRGSPTGFLNETRFDGSTPRYQLGYTVVIPGDLDGNGIDDVAVAAPQPFVDSDGGYVQLLYHDYSAANDGDDADGDGVTTALDNCPVHANTGQLDLDGDGSGDACDSDIDSDGLANATDNCPLVATLDQTDTDGDLDGDLCDVDDDNDRVADTDDLYPLNPKYNADSDSDSLPDAYETLYGLNPNDATDALADLDLDGRNNRDEFAAGTDITNDDVAPVVLAGAPVTVNATGPLTPVQLDPISATDTRDGALVAVAERAGPFWPGVNTVTWSATDAAGNVASNQQTINVVPLVGFVGDTLLAAEGMQAKVRVALNGDAINYPVTVEASLGGDAAAGSDFVLGSATAVIDNTNVAVFSLDIIADGVAEPDETLTLTLGMPDNAQAGGATAFTVHITDGNRAPDVQIATEQNQLRLTTATLDGPAVTLSAQVTDANTSDDHAFDWRHSAFISPQEGHGKPTFTIDPANLVEGVHTVWLEVSDNGSPVMDGGARRYLKVIATSPELQAGMDSDGDGTADTDEGLRDSNDNAVSDYLDPSYFAHHVPARTGTLSLIQVDHGYQLSLGRVALETGDDAMVSMGDIEAFGNFGRPASNVDDPRFSYPGGIYSVDISGLPSPGHFVNVVFPQATPIPDGASFRLFGPQSGWKDFNQVMQNGVASAQGEPGVCPAAGSTLYLPGLTPGHHCVQIRTQDNGANDSYFAGNKTLQMVGGIAVLKTPLTVNASGASIADSTVQTGDTGIVMLRFSLDSNSSDVVLNTLDLDASGTGDDISDISSVRLWIDINGDGVVDAGDSEAGNGIYNDDNGELSLQMVSPVALDAGTTHFIVTYDF